MDESVLRAIAKWPNVPNVFGWLSLDRRGSWLIKGDAVTNDAVRAFIARNYGCDDKGQWFFQNGPQRVYVGLGYTPYVIRTSSASDGTPSLSTHTGMPLESVTGAWLDEEGNILLRFPAGIGCVCDRDLAEVLAWLSDAAGDTLCDDDLEVALDAPLSHGTTGWWLNYRSRRIPVGRIDSSQVSRKFGFEPCPLPAPGQPDC